MTRVRCLSCEGGEPCSFCGGKGYRESPSPEIGAALVEALEALGADKETAGKVVDLMEALKASLDAARARDLALLERLAFRCGGCGDELTWTYLDGERVRVDRCERCFPDGAVRSHPDRVDGRPQDATPDASPDEAP